MPKDVLIERGQVVEALYDAMHRSDVGMRHTPLLLKRVLREGMWRERKDRVLPGKVIRFERFDDFVSEHPPEGLGATVDLLRRILAADPESLDLLDRELQRKPGNPTGANQHGGTVYNINGSSSRPVGTARDAALRRLRKDRPDLHERVIAGEVSPHAAMVEAGFRRKTATVPIDVERAADALARAFPADALARLVELLTARLGRAR